MFQLACPQIQSDRKNQHQLMVLEVGNLVAKNPLSEELIRIVVEEIHDGIGSERDFVFLVSSEDDTLDQRLGLGQDFSPFIKAYVSALNSNV